MSTKSQATTFILTVALLGCIGGPVGTSGQTSPADRRIGEEARKKDREVMRPGVFPLVCRGGKGIRFKLSATPGGGKVVVSFLGGTAPADEGLLPGHCSWKDRGFRDGEPLSICHDVTTFVVGFGAEASSGVVATLLETGFGDYLGALRLDISLFTFNVSNVGNCLKVQSRVLRP